MRAWTSDVVSAEGSRPSAAHCSGPSPSATCSSSSAWPATGSLRNRGPPRVGPGLSIGQHKHFIWPTTILSFGRAPQTSPTVVPQPLHPRFAAEALERSLADSPVVLIHGPRQSGKTTLVQ